MHVDLTKSAKAQEVMKKLGCRNPREMVLLLYNCPVKQGFRAIAKYLGLNPHGSIRYIILKSKRKNPRGGVYRTIDNIVKDLDYFVEKGRVYKDLLSYTPSLRIFIEKCGGKEKAKKRLEELAKYTISQACNIISKETGIKMRGQKLFSWLAQLDLSLKFKRSGKALENIIIPEKALKLMREKGITFKDLAIKYWGMLGDLRRVAEELGFPTVRKLDKALRIIDPDFGAAQLTRM